MIEIKQGGKVKLYKSKQAQTTYKKKKLVHRKRINEVNLFNNDIIKRLFTINCETRRIKI